jgi:uncharacterized protein (DUF952 family)
MPVIYHMASGADWDAALRAGSYAGSADDRRDGFIHFSTASQVKASAAKHRAGQAGLKLLIVETAALGAALKWEPARGGDLFPHLYGSLPVAAVTRAVDLPLGPDGLHLFPELA